MKIFFYVFILLLNPLLASQVFHKHISILKESPHPAVYRSIISGFNKLGITYNVNPSKSSEFGDIVICLDGISSLKRAIKLKNKNRIKKLVVGPSMVGRATEHNHILTNSAIDYYLTPSEWNMIGYVEDEPALKRVIHIWPAGVDSEYWQPQNNLKNKSKVLIYWKTESQEFCDKVKNILLSYGWEPLIIKYGNYKQEHYKELLSQVKFAVFISVTESQGLALAECWAMNIPTLVWDCQKPLEYLGKTYHIVSSCPYLTEQTGKRWKELKELEELLKNIESYWHEFNPREWVLNNMTDEISVNLLLKIINE
ncbi:MAG: hypothetical protein K2X90_04015 [Candidatus Babeliaceae bacterium]|nr:hypothetical protein [Candidatus Babeliaceae bacterium]